MIFIIFQHLKKLCNLCNLFFLKLLFYYFRGMFRLCFCIERFCTWTTNDLRNPIRRRCSSKITSKKNDNWIHSTRKVWLCCVCSFFVHSSLFMFVSLFHSFLLHVCSCFFQNCCLWEWWSSFRFTPIVIDGFTLQKSFTWENQRFSSFALW